MGLVTKHAGSVRKGFALIFGILLSGVIQAIVQPDIRISNEQILGGLLAALSLYIHSTNPPTPKKTDRTMPMAESSLMRLPRTTPSTNRAPITPVINAPTSSPREFFEPNTRKARQTPGNEA